MPTSTEYCQLDWLVTEQWIVANGDMTAELQQKWFFKPVLFLKLFVWEKDFTNNINIFTEWCSVCGFVLVLHPNSPQKTYHGEKSRAQD